MEQSPSSEAKNCSGIQEIPHILWNWNVHNHVHNNLPLGPAVSQMNPIHILTHYLFF